MVATQLVERSLPIPEVRSSNPVISKNLYSSFTVNCINKTKIKTKEAGNGQLKKPDLYWVSFQTCNTIYCKWGSFQSLGSGELPFNAIYIHSATILFLMGHPDLFLFIFGLFKQTNKAFFTTNQCWKSIRCRELNPWPLDHESSPKTTRQGITPVILLIFCTPTRSFKQSKICHQTYRGSIQKWN